MEGVVFLEVEKFSRRRRRREKTKKPESFFPVFVAPWLMPPSEERSLPSSSSLVKKIDLKKKQEKKNSFYLDRPREEVAVMRQPRRKGRAVVEDKGLPSLGPTELLLEGVDLVPPGEGLLLGAREGEVLGLGDVFHFFIIIIFFFAKRRRGRGRVFVVL